MFPRGGQCRTFCGKRATGAAGGGHSRTGSWEVSRSLRKTCHWASSHGPAASHCEGAHVGQSAFAHRPTARAPTGTLRSGGPPNASARRGGMARERARSATPASARAPTASGAAWEACHSGRCQCAGCHRRAVPCEGSHRRRARAPTARLRTARGHRLGRAPTAPFATWDLRSGGAPVFGGRGPSAQLRLPWEDSEKVPPPGVCCDIGFQVLLLNR